MPLDSAQLNVLRWPQVDEYVNSIRANIKSNREQQVWKESGRPDNGATTQPRPRNDPRISPEGEDHYDILRNEVRRMDTRRHIGEIQPRRGGARTSYGLGDRRTSDPQAGVTGTRSRSRLSLLKGVLDATTNAMTFTGREKVELVQDGEK
ncbi:hypothetical protein BBBOND_0110150 [Babesia bigemina]|uniref:Uncharacterized protein n=1 Tax=Babesia bigemina TaxID=5866 RepID=A0A061D3S6_BABBI|nr:hypothetical protein BBBOND_0110150 [Babesia bigemina]CDR94717.1 hypothetical protein BBBOND_0110150 [Babesia bigemina]|eukprot:XP_012766903.1 hypothetical protein BBBOND_0110150 [Babesia bigemina]